MFHSRKLNHRINKIHERALRIVYNDHQCTFEELLEREVLFYDSRKKPPEISH